MKIIATLVRNIISTTEISYSKNPENIFM